MSLRFRKSIKIAPNVKLNLTQNGISSVSVGKNGARVNISDKGTRSTLGLNGTGVSYTHKKSSVKQSLSTHIKTQLLSIARENAVFVYTLAMKEQDTQEIVQEQVQHIFQQLSPLPKNQQNEGLDIYIKHFETWVDILEKAHQKWIDSGNKEEDFSPKGFMEETESLTNENLTIWVFSFIGIVVLLILLYAMFN